jgi:NADPH:quinone reductase
MRAARCHAYGPPDDLVLEEVPDPVPGPGEALVEVSAAAVNFPDLLIISGSYQVRWPPPFVPGSEFAGTVAAVGDGVTEVAPGDRVCGSAAVGAFAQRLAVPAAALWPVPAGVPLADAAAFTVAYRTAYHALRTVAEVGAGEWAVVLGAAGGVGLAAVDVAGQLGARVVAVASTARKRAVCRARGADVVLDAGAGDLKEQLKEVTSGGADVVIDPVGGRCTEQAVRACRWGARFVVLGFASGEIPRLPLNLVLLKGVTVTGFEVRTFAGHRPAQAARDRQELAALYAAGRIRPHIGARYPLDEVADALRLVAGRGAIGKVLVDIGA